MNADQIRTETKTFTYPDGRVFTWEIEAADVSMTLGAETRTITIERSSPSHVWMTAKAVTCKYRTGNKFHAMRVQVVDKNGKFVWVYQNSHGKHGVRPVAWPETVKPNAKW